ncbi:hypothetical protein D3C73_1169490 [compost metagenome]
MYIVPTDRKPLSHKKELIPIDVAFPTVKIKIVVIQINPKLKKAPTRTGSHLRKILKNLLITYLVAPFALVSSVLSKCSLKNP